MSPPRVFIVEEDRELRDLLLDLLLSEGDIVCTFDSGDEAVEYAARDGLPDLIYFGSLRLFLHVHEQREVVLGRVGVVLATGAVSVPAFSRVELLRKPFAIDDLFSAIARAKRQFSDPVLGKAAPDIATAQVYDLARAKGFRHPASSRR